ncbi:SBP domain-containing protein [Cephalotus follicularis]|uniref:SBP domain-containing protein n=1 Tax=Cephalotus follicularis TaxID=3775 RepID=A0A1Q3DCF5_CEPFO|nr:SBP domain-containing protein [Cephalotus follicularis]
MESSSSSGSSKRARAGTQVLSCLVDGCIADLSKCRDYHRRHKVCELHSKTSVVTIRGQEQRFCQQCSRFHSLVEFDEGKRSCRKRLDGHNRRRRKPQPDSLFTNSASFLSNHQGTKYIPFRGSQMFSNSAISSPWSRPEKSEANVMLYNSPLQLNFSDRKNVFPVSLSHNYREGKQFSFLQGTNTALPGASVSRTLLNAHSSSNNGCSSQKMLSNRLNLVVDPNRALSLLSIPLSETREIGLRHMVQPDSIPPAQCFISSQQHNHLGMAAEPSWSALFSDGSDANLRRQDMLQIWADGSSSSGAQQTLSFSWE